MGQMTKKKQKQKFYVRSGREKAYKKQFLTNQSASQPRVRKANKK